VTVTGLWRAAQCTRRTMRRTVQPLQADRRPGRTSGQTNFEGPTHERFRSRVLNFAYPSAAHRRTHFNGPDRRRSGDKRSPQCPL
jgi:hypothetical protein